jgi:hypothetical protein
VPTAAEEEMITTRLTVSLALHPIPSRISVVPLVAGSTKSRVLLAAKRRNGVYYVIEGDVRFECIVECARDGDVW